MIKSILAVSAALICLTGDITVQKASASVRCNTTPTNYRVCTDDAGRLGTDVVAVFTPKNQLVTTLKVICTGNSGNRWESYGSWTKSANQDLANWWCRNY